MTVGTDKERQVVVNGKIAIAVARAERAEGELSDLRARLKAEVAAADKRVGQKISMLRLIFVGIAALMGYLGALTLVNWYVPGSLDADGIGASYFQMSKDILLVLTGILGSAMANVFDGGRSTGRASDTADTPAATTAPLDGEPPQG